MAGRRKRLDTTAATQGGTVEVAIVGGGIGGLSLALSLKRRGIDARVYEAAPEIKAIGVGINVLPHGARILGELGLEADLAGAAVTTKEAAFFNRFGQLIYREPLGRYAGYEAPQFSIHRGDLHLILLEHAKRALGAGRIHAGWRCVGVESDDRGAAARFVGAGEQPLPPQHADVVIACDGIHSAIRKQFYPNEGPPRYSGVNMWRGVTRMQPILSGASMVRAGWLTHGKMVIYPIRNDIDPPETS
jgi:2-polyprenyl-6-methoxyphenol hydroxylase-like FAD-dependent oxidoreductase